MADDPTTGTDAERTIRATQGWNRLNRSLTIDLRKSLSRAEKARRRIKARR